VALQGVVSPGGCVSVAYIVSSADRRFEPEGLKTAALFRFDPAKRRGAPATAVVRFEIAFNLRP
jgi:outer membrane biosynthesis protein TonB